MNRTGREEYDERRAALFGGAKASRSATVASRTVLPAGDGATTDARSSDHSATGGIFLTGAEVVHGLLRLNDIRDPDRWLRRHGAPVAFHTGSAKRYLPGE